MYLYKVKDMLGNSIKVTQAEIKFQFDKFVSVHPWTGIYDANHEPIFECDKVEIFDQLGSSVHKGVVYFINTLTGFYLFDEEKKKLSVYPLGALVKNHTVKIIKE